MLAAYAVSRTAGPLGPGRPFVARLFCDGTDRLPVATVAAAPADIVGTEVHVPRVVRVVRIEGRGPVVAVGSRIVQTRATPVARGGKEDALVCVACLITGYNSTGLTGSFVIAGPCPSAIGP